MAQKKSLKYPGIFSIPINRMKIFFAPFNQKIHFGNSEYKLATFNAFEKQVYQKETWHNLQ